MQVMVIPTDAPAEVREIGTGLDALQEIVGGWIEMVPLRGDLPGHAYINEEGKIHGLPINPQATRLAHIFPGDYIAGTMIVMGPVDDEGNETPVRDEVVRYIKAM